MVMPPCGTFHYAGVVPDMKAALESGQWVLEERSGPVTQMEPTPAQTWKFWKRDSRRDSRFDELRDNRLVGLEPTLRISEGHLVLEAATQYRAQIRSASLEVGRGFIETLEGGDVLTVVRTASADIGISLLRRGVLIAAVGAVTETPLGDDVGVRGGPAMDPAIAVSEQWPRSDTWVEVSVSDQTLRLRGGEATTIGKYRVSVVRCFKDGIPGTCESLAVSLEGLCAHAAAVRSAELLARPNAGLMMTDWP